MKHKKLIISSAILLTVASFSVIMVVNKYKNLLFHEDFSYSNIISFGDSLSDKGNTYKKSLETIPNDNTWFNGRFSNNKVWVEYLCDYSKDRKCKLIDNAYGGAYSKNGYQDIKLNDKSIIKLITNLLQQVENFVKKDKSYNPNTTLYTMEIGANDIMDLGAAPSIIAQNIDTSLNLLIKKEKAKHIAFLNLPDFSKAPRYAKASVKKRESIHNRVIETNELTKKIIEKYKSEGIDIKIIDFHKLLNSLLKNKNLISDKPCLNIPLKTGKLDFLIDYRKTKNCESKLNKYIFFDNLHPSNIIHQKLAKLTRENF
ncbi:SGNH/GDSL hydrolase family protein [Francisella sp. Scap27]|uniref:SGNH/GDSL hydrolase family protein n=1 Tax=Francisella sp. Scap27 TaxID=2589986 RepID=UPI0015BC9C23|nr:SGNH/GDSL hydrolase family protein [Francisella sp. Scap27]QLE78653.1 SGNH/GDSL hydrolase family protein [Francisella sp. Scap27]